MTITAATTTATTSATARVTAPAAARRLATTDTRPHTPPSDDPAPGGRLLALVPARLEDQARRVSGAAQALLDEPPPPLPDTGATAAATRRALERLGSRADRTAGDADALAAGLDRVVELLREADDAVASALSRVRSGATR